MYLFAGILNYVYANNMEECYKIDLLSEYEIAANDNTLYYVTETELYGFSKRIITLPKNNPISEQNPNEKVVKV